MNASITTASIILLVCVINVYFFVQMQNTFVISSCDEKSPLVPIDMPSGSGSLESSIIAPSTNKRQETKKRDKALVDGAKVHLTPARELPPYSSHKCIESTGPQHRMCLFKRVCKRKRVSIPPPDNGHRSFTYYMPEKNRLLHATSFRSNGIMRERERTVQQPVRLWGRTLDKAGNAEMDPSFHWENAAFPGDDATLVDEPVVLIHAFVPDNHGHQLLETMLSIYEMIRNVWPKLLHEDGSTSFRVAVVSKNDITHPDHKNTPLEPNTALFKWIEMITGKPLLFFDDFGQDMCFRNILMGTGFRGFLGDPGRPFGMGMAPLPPAQPLGRGLIMRGFRDFMWKVAAHRTHAESEEAVWVFSEPTEEPKCLLRVILHRKTTSRGIIDADSLAEVLRERYSDGFDGCRVDFKVTEWGTGNLVRPVDQIALLRHTDVYISPPGSASFLGMFLPESAGLITMPQCAIPSYYMAMPEWTNSINHLRWTVHEGEQAEARASLRALFCDMEFYCCNDWETTVHASYPHVHHLVYPLSSHILEPQPYEPFDDQPFLFSKLLQAGPGPPKFNGIKAMAQAGALGGHHNVTEPYIDTRTGSIRVDPIVLGDLLDEAFAHRLNHLREAAQEDQWNN